MRSVLEWLAVTAFFFALNAVGAVTIWLGLVALRTIWTNPPAIVMFAVGAACIWLVLWLTYRLFGLIGRRQRHRSQVRGPA